MPKKLYPGVYIEEISNGVAPIEGVGTSTAAFIGETEKGLADRALMVTSFAEFQANFGNSLRESWLSYSVSQFFNNGGTRLYIARVTGHASTVPQEIDYQKAFSLLDSITDINLVAVPGVGSPSMVSYGADYCQKRRDCFFIGDMSLSDNTVEKAQTFIDDIETRSSYAAVYFPWLKMKDPSGVSSDLIAVPPSGSVAGIYGRIDAAQGVWKAAAGGRSNINGAVGLWVDASDRMRSTLNPIGGNAIRAFPGSGVVIWGAQTLDTQSNLVYRYVPVRRTAIYIEQSIYNAIQWAVFEPNDANLWASLRRTIGAFMNAQWRAGAFSGDTPKSAFFVKCGKETTTYADIEAGIINIEVGFAPLKPAEFLVLKLSQKTGQFN